MEKNTRYLKQYLVVRTDLSMPAGKLGAMCAHVAMTFLSKRLIVTTTTVTGHIIIDNPEQIRWLTEMDPGLEDQGQVSMGKIVLQVKDEAELLAVEEKAKGLNLECQRVVDCGYSHNKPNTLVAIAIGPDWPENLKPVTGHLKIYR